MKCCCRTKTTTKIDERVNSSPIVKIGVPLCKVSIEEMDEVKTSPVSLSALYDLPIYDEEVGDEPVSPCSSYRQRSIHTAQASAKKFTHSLTFSNAHIFMLNSFILMVIFACFSAVLFSFPSRYDSEGAAHQGTSYPEVRFKSVSEETAFFLREGNGNDYPQDIDVHVFRLVTPILQVGPNVWSNLELCNNRFHYSSNREYKSYFHDRYINEPVLENSVLYISLTVHAFVLPLSVIFAYHFLRSRDIEMRQRRDLVHCKMKNQHRENCYAI